MVNKKGVRVEMDEKKLSEAVEGKEVYPSILCLDEDDLAEIKDWKVGDTYKVELEVKMVKASAKGDMGPMDDSDKKQIHAEFEVVKAETYDDKEEKK